MITMKTATPGLKRLAYASLDEARPVQELEAPDRVTLLVSRPDSTPGPVALGIGDEVKTGQLLRPFGDSLCTVAPVTGKIEGHRPFPGPWGKNYLALTLRREAEDQWEESFPAEPERQDLGLFFACAPGAPRVGQAVEKQAIHTLVVSGLDLDLVANGNQRALWSRTREVLRGIEVTRQALEVERVILAVPPHLSAALPGAEVEIRPVEPRYPNGLPYMLVLRLLGKVLPAQTSPLDEGICIVGAETMAALGGTCASGRLPVSKLVTVVGKDGRVAEIEARIGTAVADILAAVDARIDDYDRLILGGPMRGNAVYSPDYPLGPEVGAVMVQDAKDIVPVVDAQCINCGECVRVCPTRVPVNMLVRYLAFGRYQDAADEYDLYCCIECGLCSYVCPVLIPVFQYIMLGKYELAKTGTGETASA